MGIRPGLHWVWQPWVDTDFSAETPELILRDHFHSLEKKDEGGVIVRTQGLQIIAFEL